MAATYGEQLLAHAEARANLRAARRRIGRLFVPFLIVVIWATLDLLSARSVRLAGAGAFHRLFDHVVVVGWTAAFVIAPMAAALKRDPMPSGAALSFIAGPIVSPLLFGSGWAFWQSAVVAIVASLTLLSARARSH
jgi:hypothetical protein